MKAPIAFDGDYVAFTEQNPCFAHWVRRVDWLTCTGGQVGFGSAGWACYSLGMESPVKWGDVFFLAEPAKGKLAHGCVPIGQPLDCRESRSTVSACNKEVFVSRVLGSRSS